MAEKFPWREVMAFGLGSIRLPPATFWSATLRELSAAADGMRGRLRDPIERSALEQLMQRFPDNN